MLRFKSNGLIENKSDLNGKILSVLFGLSISIAILDRLPVAPAIPISLYRVLHLPILIGVIVLLFSRMKIAWHPYNLTLLALAGFLLVMGISTFTASHQLTALIHLLRYLEYTFISVLLFLILVNCWRSSYWTPFSWGMLITAFLASITILTDFANITSFYHLFTAHRPYVRHMGILGEANYGAGKLCVLLPFTLYLESIYLKQRNWGKVFIITGAGLVIVLAIFVTGSRTGGLLGALILGGFLLKEARWLFRPTVLLILFIAVGLILSTFILVQPESFSKALTYVTNRYGVLIRYLQTGEEKFRYVRESSIRERIDVFRAGIRMFVSYPVLGIGLGNFPLVIGEYAPKYSHVYSHNTYLSVFVELGIVGWFLFIFLCLRIIFLISRVVLSSDGDFEFYPYLLLSCLSLFLIFFFLHEFDSKYFWTLFLPVALALDA